MLQQTFNDFGAGLTREQRKRIFVGYGDGCFPSHGPRGERAVPVMRARRVWGGTWPTVCANEGYTTITVLRAYKDHKSLSRLFSGNAQRHQTIFFFINYPPSMASNAVNPTLEHALLREPAQIDLEEVDVSVPDRDFDIDLSVEDHATGADHLDEDRVGDPRSAPSWTELGLDEFSTPS